MRGWRQMLHNLPQHLLIWTGSALLFLQMGLAFFVFREPRLAGLRDKGWATRALGVDFAILPIFALRARGGVQQAKIYMETTARVDSGICALVRHPQGGTAGILLNLALPLIGQHWSLVLLAVVAIVVLYADVIKADQACIEKFGLEYERYVQQVPRVNFVAGIMRLLVRRRPESTEA